MRVVGWLPEPNANPGSRRKYTTVLSAGAAASFRDLVDNHGESELYGETLFLLGESLYRMEKYEQAAG